MPPSRRIALTFLFCGLVLGLTTGAYTIIQVHRLVVDNIIYERLSKRGVDAEAKIVSLNEINQWMREVYEISYLFYGMDAKLEPAWFAKNTTISEDSYHRLTNARQVDILFDPLDPNVSNIKIEFRPPKTESYILAGVTAIMCLIGLALFVKGIGITRSTRRLAASGKTAVATVIDVWTEASDGDGNLHCIAYEFNAQTSKGLGQTVRSAEGHPDDIRPLFPVVGGTLTVRYLPQNPRICRIEWPMA